MSLRAIVVAFVMLSLAAIGCKSAEESNGSDAGHDTSQAGSTGTLFDAMVQPALDAGVNQPTDAGDASMPMLPPNFVLKCDGELPTPPTHDVLTTWEAERTAHGALGYPAKLSLQGSDYRVSGRGVASTLKAPFALVMNGESGGLVGFLEAQIEGVAQQGRVELYAGQGDAGVQGYAPVSAGSLEGLALESLSVEDGKLDGKIDLVSEPLGPGTVRFQSGASATKLAVENAVQVYLYPDGSLGGTEDRVTLMPKKAVVFPTASSLHFYDDGDVALKKDLSAPLTLGYDAFGVAGDFAGGALEISALKINSKPLAVFGLSTKLQLAANKVSADKGVRVTQAVNEAGLMIPAAIEVVPEAPEVWVKPNTTRIVKFYYRERSYLGDAVLGDIQLGGSAGDLLELETGFMHTYTAELIDAVLDTGWAAPIAAIVTLPTISIVFVIDIFDCIFGGCASQPDPLAPFPQWMNAGQTGTMEVRVKAGGLGVGSYDTSLTFVGRNYCPVTVPLKVNIGDEPAIVDASVDAEVSDGGLLDAN